MNYSKVIFYHFSGTGNSLLAARWMHENALQMGTNSEMRAIDRFGDIEKPEEGSLVGFIFPTHGFNLPWYMLKFIWKFPKSKNTSVFLLNTRAGMKMTRFIFTPGLNGIALILPWIILLCKGFSIKGLFSLDMPSNWISLHPGIKTKVVDSIVERCHCLVNRFSEKIFSGKRNYHISSYLFLPLDLAIIPISLGYLMYGRFILSKTFIADTDCTNCRICEKMCPCSAITIRDKRPYWTMSCESCMRCMNICPEKAIQTSHSFAFLLVYSTTLVPASYYISLFLKQNYPALSDYLDLISFLPQWGLSLLIFFTLYLAFFWVTRVKWINYLFAYTSFTRFWRRYRAPGIRIADYRKDNLI